MNQNVNSVNKIYAMIKADGSYWLNAPLVGWLGGGLIVVGIILICIGVFLIVLTTVGVKV